MKFFCLQRVVLLFAAVKFLFAACWSFVCSCGSLQSVNFQCAGDDFLTCYLCKDFFLFAVKAVSPVGHRRSKKNGVPIFTKNFLQPYIGSGFTTLRGKHVSEIYGKVPLPEVA